MAAVTSVLSGIGTLLGYPEGEEKEGEAPASDGEAAPSAEVDEVGAAETEGAAGSDEAAPAGPGGAAPQS
jgi:hypothetical protein